MILDISHPGLVPQDGAGVHPGRNAAPFGHVEENKQHILADELNPGQPVNREGTAAGGIVREHIIRGLGRQAVEKLRSEESADG